MKNIYYAECHRSHSDLGGKVDGCLEFQQCTDDHWSLASICDVCGCNRGYHRKVVECKKEVVYTKCHKNHDLKIPNSVDGCQEFISSSNRGLPLICAVCGCHKGFHRNEITTLSQTQLDP